MRTNVAFVARYNGGMNRQEWRERGMTPIGAIIKHNIELATTDPIARGGFTQVPNFILKDSGLSLGAKVTYSLFLHYAWHNDSCFPGQDRLGQDMGMSTSRTNEFIKELEAVGLVEITRRGQGKTNLYKLHFVIKRSSRRKS